MVYGLILIIGSNPAMAAPTPVLLPVAPGSASAPLPAHIGVVAGVKGNVQINSPGQVGRIVSSGEPIHLGDEIATGPEGNLQILLLDQTIFTIGPNSAMKIDKFVYDPSNDNGEVKAEIVKGIFRFVTGKIARKKPENMEVKLPTGTIGVRGTIVMGEASRTRSTAVLLGPGERTNTGSRIGRFILTSDINGKIEKTEVTRPGFGASIDANGALSAAFRLPPQEMARMTQAFEPVQGPPPPQNQQGGQPQPQNQQGNPPQNQQGPYPQGGEPRGMDQSSPTQQAGQDKAGARGALGTLGNLGGIFQKFEREGDKASQNAGNFNNNPNQNLLGATTRNQLQTAAQMNTGVYHYSQTSTQLFRLGNPVGSYSFQFDIDFGSRKVGGGNSRVAGTINLQGNPTAQPFQFNLGPQDFGSGPGPALFQYNSVPNSLSGDCASCTANINIGLGNSSNTVAAAANHNVIIREEVSPNIFVDRGNGGGGSGRSEGRST